MPRIAAAQMNSMDFVKPNLDQIGLFFSQAKAKQADLLVLPENVAFIGRKPTDQCNIAEDWRDGEIQDCLSRLAKTYQLWVIAGTIPLKADNQRVRASSLVFNDQGHCVARYDKIHLFDVQVSISEIHKESAVVEAGDKLVVVETPVGKIGLTVCYDLRFPELYYQLMKKGAEIFSIPAAFTAITGSAHWEVLLKARAIENLCYVVAPNQWGTRPDGHKTYGHTSIIEPWGKIIAYKESGVGIITADIDLERLRQLRQQFPCNEHHRINHDSTVNYR